MDSLEEMGWAVFITAVFVGAAFWLYSIEKARDREFIQACTSRFSVNECNFMVELDGQERANYLILKGFPDAK